MTRQSVRLGLLAARRVRRAPAQAQTYYHYQCADGAAFEVALYPETKAAYLQIDGKSLQLPKRFSLTSQRFRQGRHHLLDEERRSRHAEARRQDHRSAR